ncbi:hypothetical protein Htur_5024 (plasmid) [Haloterrigena turkmenica DSM 5511]|uniref:Uncharacterized protein n=1 Tax=Haloterrigena turkmenica (strain ATCC 51198 / DSM 5511 / JCM 9101 / NCIMB 13204 / VKM B-1734 / 4k) TaxID=543526 RepID=D2S3G5_HALTV|nr:hypothetical protein [Haloterrigena turkmenica]ADB63912.1 hypothetical protein Htur_5024 [Haloterrigena turkmenica DSM 5511]
MTTKYPSLEPLLHEIGVDTGPTTPRATVDRRYAPFIGTESEPFEYLRDALRRETRLRVTPPDPWRIREDSRRAHSWTIPRLGYEVRLTTDGIRDGWTLEVNGDVELADASRLEAFERAAERMSEIAAHVPAEVSE